MESNGFIVVSGLPASGKTAIGRLMADALDWPFLDKDDFLEAEFDNFPVVDVSLRQTLSRESDRMLAERAMALASGVLVSFWRPTDRLVSYGTATDWITDMQLPVVELHCRCDPEVARERFTQRKRHPGHNDASRHDSLVKQFGDLASLGPLGHWPCATIETSDLSDIATLANQAVRDVQRLI